MYEKVSCGKDSLKRAQNGEWDSVTAVSVTFEINKPLQTFIVQLLMKFLLFF